MENQDSQDIAGDDDGLYDFSEEQTVRSTSKMEEYDPVNLDLYDALVVEEGHQQMKSFEELQCKFEEATQQITSLMTENEALKRSVQEEESKRLIIQKNISSLLLTARAEIKRKEMEIRNLRIKMKSGYGRQQTTTHNHRNRQPRYPASEDSNTTLSIDSSFEPLSFSSPSVPDNLKGRLMQTNKDLNRHSRDSTLVKTSDNLAESSFSSDCSQTGRLSEREKLRSHRKFLCESNRKTDNSACLESREVHQRFRNEDRGNTHSEHSHKSQEVKRTNRPETVKPREELMSRSWSERERKRNSDTSPHKHKQETERHGRGGRDKSERNNNDSPEHRRSQATAVDEKDRHVSTKSSRTTHSIETRSKHQSDEEKDKKESPKVFDLREKLRQGRLKLQQSKKRDDARVEIVTDSRKHHSGALVNEIISNKKRKLSGDENHDYSKKSKPNLLESNSLCPPLTSEISEMENPDNRAKTSPEMTGSSIKKPFKRPLQKNDIAKTLKDDLEFLTSLKQSISKGGQKTVSVSSVSRNHVNNASDSSLMIDQSSMSRNVIGYQDISLEVENSDAERERWRKILSSKSSSVSSMSEKESGVTSVDKQTYAKTPIDRRDAKCDNTSKNGVLCNTSVIPEGDGSKTQKIAISSHISSEKQCDLSHKKECNISLEEECNVSVENECQLTCERVSDISTKTNDSVNMSNSSKKDNSTELLYAGLDGDDDENVHESFIDETDIDIDVFRVRGDDEKSDFDNDNMICDKLQNGETESRLAADSFIAMSVGPTVVTNDSSVMQKDGDVSVKSDSSGSSDCSDSSFYSREPDNGSPNPNDSINSSIDKCLKEDESEIDSHRKGHRPSVSDENGKDEMEGEVTEVPENSKTVLGERSANLSSVQVHGSSSAKSTKADVSGGYEEESNQEEYCCLKSPTNDNGLLYKFFKRPKGARNNRELRVTEEPREEMSNGTSVSTNEEQQKKSSKNKSKASATSEQMEFKSANRPDLLTDSVDRLENGPDILEHENLCPAEITEQISVKPVELTGDTRMDVIGSRVEVMETDDAEDDVTRVTSVVENRCSDDDDVSQTNSKGQGKENMFGECNEAVKSPEAKALRSLKEENSDSELSDLESQTNTNQGIDSEEAGDIGLEESQGEDEEQEQDSGESDAKSSESDSNDEGLYLSSEEDTSLYESQTSSGEKRTQSSSFTESFTSEGVSTVDFEEEEESDGEDEDMSVVSVDTEESEDSSTDTELKSGSEQDQLPTSRSSFLKSVLSEVTRIVDNDISEDSVTSYFTTDSDSKEGGPPPQRSVLSDTEMEQEQVLEITETQTNINQKKSERDDVSVLKSSLSTAMTEKNVSEKTCPETVKKAELDEVSFVKTTTKTTTNLLPHTESDMSSGLVSHDMKSIVISMTTSSACAPVKNNPFLIEDEQLKFSVDGVNNNEESLESTDAESEIDHATLMRKDVRKIALGKRVSPSRLPGSLVTFQNNSPTKRALEDAAYQSPVQVYHSPEQVFNRSPIKVSYQSPRKISPGKHQSPVVHVPDRQKVLVQASMASKAPFTADDATEDTETLKVQMPVGSSATGIYSSSKHTLNYTNLQEKNSPPKHCTVTRSFDFTYNKEMESGNKSPLTVSESETGLRRSPRKQIRKPARYSAGLPSSDSNLNRPEPYRSISLKEFVRNTGEHRRQTIARGKEKKKEVSSVGETKKTQGENCVEDEPTTRLTFINGRYRRVIVGSPDDVTSENGSVIEISDDSESSKAFKLQEELPDVSALFKEDRGILSSFEKEKQKLPSSKKTTKKVFQPSDYSTKKCDDALKKLMSTPPSQRKSPRKNVKNRDSSTTAVVCSSSKSHCVKSKSDFGPPRRSPRKRPSQQIITPVVSSESKNRMKERPDHEKPPTADVDSLKLLHDSPAKRTRSMTKIMTESETSNKQTDNVSSGMDSSTSKLEATSTDQERKCSRKELFHSEMESEKKRQETVKSSGRSVKNGPSKADLLCRDEDNSQVAKELSTTVSLGGSVSHSASGGREKKHSSRDQDKDRRDRSARSKSHANSKGDLPKSKASPKSDEKSKLDSQMKTLPDNEKEKISERKLFSVQERKSKLLPESKQNTGPELLPENKSKSSSEKKVKPVYGDQVKSAPESIHKNVSEDKPKIVQDVKTKKAQKSNPRKVPESKAMSMSESKAKRVSESKARSLSESKAKSVSESEAKPVSESKAKPVSESKAKPVSESEDRDKANADSETKVKLASDYKLKEKAVTDSKVKRQVRTGPTPEIKVKQVLENKANNRNDTQSEKLGTNQTRSKADDKNRWTRNTTIEKQPVIDNQAQTASVFAGSKKKKGSFADTLFDYDTAILKLNRRKLASRKTTSDKDPDIASDKSSTNGKQHRQRTEERVRQQIKGTEKKIVSEVILEKPVTRSRSSSIQSSSVESLKEKSSKSLEKMLTSEESCSSSGSSSSESEDSSSDDESKIELIRTIFGSSTSSSGPSSQTIESSTTDVTMSQCSFVSETSRGRGVESETEEETPSTECKVKKAGQSISHPVHNTRGQTKQQLTSREDSSNIRSSKEKMKTSGQPAASKEKSVSEKGTESGIDKAKENVPTSRGVVESLTQEKGENEWSGILLEKESESADSCLSTASTQIYGDSDSVASGLESDLDSLTYVKFIWNHPSSGQGNGHGEHSKLQADNISFHDQSGRRQSSKSEELVDENVSESSSSSLPCLHDHQKHVTDDPSSDPDLTLLSVCQVEEKYTERDSVNSVQCIDMSITCSDTETGDSIAVQFTEASRRGRNDAPKKGTHMEEHVREVGVKEKISRADKSRMQSGSAVSKSADSTGTDKMTVDGEFLEKGKCLCDEDLKSIESKGGRKNCDDRKGETVVSLFSEDGVNYSDNAIIVQKNVSGNSSSDESVKNKTIIRQRNSNKPTVMTQLSCNSEDSKSDNDHVLNEPVSFGTDSASDESVMSAGSVKSHLSSGKRPVKEKAESPFQFSQDCVLVLDVDDTLDGVDYNDDLDFDEEVPDKCDESCEADDDKGLEDGELESSDGEISSDRKMSDTVNKLKSAEKKTATPRRISPRKKKVFSPIKFGQSDSDANSDDLDYFDRLKSRRKYSGRQHLPLKTRSELRNDSRYHIAFNSRENSPASDMSDVVNGQSISHRSSSKYCDRDSLSEGEVKQMPIRKSSRQKKYRHEREKDSPVEHTKVGKRNTSRDSRDGHVKNFFDAKISSRRIVDREPSPSEKQFKKRELNEFESDSENCYTPEKPSSSSSIQRHLRHKLQRERLADTEEVRRSGSRERARFPTRGNIHREKHQSDSSRRKRSRSRSWSRSRSRSPTSHKRRRLSSHVTADDSDRMSLRRRHRRDARLSLRSRRDSSDYTDGDEYHTPVKEPGRSSWGSDSKSRYRDKSSRR